MGQNKLEENLISVIIPSYNRKEYLKKAIESVLKQTYQNKEIIIVDDCSNDGTEEYFTEKYKDDSRIKFYKNKENLGAGASRKNGYDKSKGNYIIFMDDDDYYTNYSFFEKAIEILESKKYISMVSSSSMIEYVNEKRMEESIMNIEGEINNVEYLSSFQQRYMKSNSTFTTVFRKIDLEKANIKEVKMLNDSSIYLRALLVGDAYILKMISGVYRIHSKNISSNLDVEFIIENIEEKYKIYEEIVKRNLLDNPKEWLKNQVLLTISFFVKFNKTGEKEINKLIEWCKNNLKEIREEIIEYIRERINE